MLHCETIVFCLQCSCAPPPYEIIFIVSHPISCLNTSNALQQPVLVETIYTFTALNQRLVYTMVLIKPQRGVVVVWVTINLLFNIGLYVALEGSIVRRVFIALFKFD